MTATTKIALQLLQNSAANQLLSNETFAQLNQLVQPAVLDKDLSSPPGSPADEALYIVGSSPTGAWSGKADQLAYWLTSTGAWQFVIPREGFLVHVNDEDQFYRYTGSSWAAFSGGGMSNPMTTAGDIITGGSSGTPQRLAAGSNGQALLIVSGAPAWGAIYNSPLTTTGDLVYSSSGSTAARLGVGANGQVLTVSGGVPTWQNSAAGFANPMTTSGDLITGGSGGTAGRLGVGSNGQVLTVSGGVPTWSTPSGLSNPMTARGDIITGGTSGTPQRLAKGTSGQMLVAGSTDPVYSNSPILGGYAELLETMSGTAIDVSSTNVKKKVMAANTTFTITGATSGQSHSFTLYLEGGTTYTVTWPASVQWVGGSTPTLAAKCRITGETLDGGTTWLFTYGGSYT
ncbi:DUF2793 domain-containing protein [Pseudomonas sp. zfem003]|uniref:DUF2793 domain-containing protein n=1 Tax=Pseudomonas sp. zfem003 TaxID=3078198 RepID=UPI002928AFF6|nr:DUF2793 domain-containing protein [Pseudomonas sp. zfem003]MDU9398021.1 DUF2793 domain-containing protein [Pseudomonas sp. zfem003]